MDATEDMRVRILLADGSEDFRFLLMQHLAGDSQMSIAAQTGDGEELLGLLARGGTDVLVMDLSLARRDGLSVLQTLAARGPLPPTLVVSALLGPVLEEKLRRLGVWGVMDKPCMLRELLTQIRRCAKGEQTERSGSAQTAERVLSSFGVPHHLNGYDYLLEALLRTAADPELLKGVTKILYPELARYFHTTPVRLERSIRTALGIGWERGDAAVRERFFGPALQQRPAIREFLAVGVPHLRAGRDADPR